MDRDGQYFHYLTKWMHALDRMARVVRDPELARWARELAITAHRRFVHGGRMYWKMSIDLMRPLVPSMGQHDPLDGYVTCVQLRATHPDRDLDGIVDELRAMIDVGGLATADPLGIGGLLFDAYRLDWLGLDRPLRDLIVAAARSGLVQYLGQRDLARAAAHRLAFRELGLAIGLAAAKRMRLGGFAQLGDDIVGFWRDDVHRDSSTYRDHRDINDVMLATSLEPSGFLDLASREQPARLA